MKEYELAGIETISRGVCIKDGKLLLCKAKGGASTYLPGGHIEFGENAREALAREVKEELGAEAEAGAFLGAVENSFIQHGKTHAEINLVFELKFSDGVDLFKLCAQEDWIEFGWYDLNALENANLLPVSFRALSAWPNVRFEC
jgi:8-oxo-dGTP pyrophosphatase MutT (NUDIX family)